MPQHFTVFLRDASEIVFAYAFAIPELKPEMRKVCTGYIADLSPER